MCIRDRRVVKVFNHEQKSKEEFDQLNEALFDSASQANEYANMMGPVIGNIGNLQFVLTAVLGGVLSVAGVGGITPVSYTHLVQTQRVIAGLSPLLPGIKVIICHTPFIYILYQLCCFLVTDII